MLAEPILRRIKTTHRPGRARPVGGDERGGAAPPGRRLAGHGRPARPHRPARRWRVSQGAGGVPRPPRRGLYPARLHLLPSSHDRARRAIDARMFRPRAVSHGTGTE